MRIVSLVRIAAEAELLRFQLMLKRHGRRAAFGAVAAVFALAVFVLLNVAGWQALCRVVEPLYATLILLGIDLVLAALFGLLAARSSPSRAERDALEVRKQAIAQMQRSLTVRALMPLAGTLWRTQRRNRRRRLERAR